ncbi:MAG TPA: hypothetical protein VF815_38875 [Myxococcaceae bacterium]|jgi:serine/threonine-protein kinase
MANVLIALIFFLNQAAPVLMAGGAAKPSEASSANQQAVAMYEDGLALAKAKQFSESLMLAEKCLTLEPKKVECHLLAASSSARLNELEKAAQHYRDFLTQAPNHEAAPRVRKLLEDFDTKKASPSQGKLKEARVAYEEGRRLTKARQHNQAVLMATRCLAIDPDMADCHMLAGAAYANLSQAEQAAHHYREFLRLAPDHPSAAKVKAILEQYDRAKPQ